MLYRLAISLLCIAVLAVPGQSFAHARWKLDGIVKPRTTDTGLKTAPCGGAARTSTPAVFTPGATITVEWEETINHPGYFRIAFSPSGDQNFDSYVLADNIIDTQDDTNTPHFYSRQITLPDLACTDCTLQLIQYMTENPAAPTLYYSCADINLANAIDLPQSITDLRASPQSNSVVLTWRNPVREYFQSLVLTSTQPIAVMPLDGQTYAAGQALGNGTVVYTGTNPFFTIQGLTPGQTYYFAVIAQDTRQRYASVVAAQATLPAIAPNTPPRTSLNLLQNNAPVRSVTTDGGPVVIQAQVTDPDAGELHSFDWSGTDNRLVDVDLRDDTLTFDPAPLQPGSYRAALTVTDSGNPPGQASAQLTIQVIAPRPTDVTPSAPSSPTKTTTKNAGGGAWSLYGLVILLMAAARRRATATLH